MRNPVYWLSRGGIALLLIGVALGCKYSIDRGWITPWIRAICGLFLGGGLTGLGLSWYDRRRPFSLLLLGGGLATFYITGFAAFQLLELVSQPVAFGFMVVVTALAFTLSLRQDDAILSLVGAVGGLVTPFLLYTGQGNVPGLVFYTCLILCGTAGMYFFKGWRSLLWVSVVGGWIILLLTFQGRTDHSDRVAQQLCLLMYWLLFWALPVFREYTASGNPARWPKSFLGSVDRNLSATTLNALDRHVHVLSVVTPLFVLFWALAVWHGADNRALWGSLVLVAAAVYGGVARALRPRPPLRSLALTHATVAVILLTASLTLYFEGKTLLFALATEAAAIHFLARRRDDPRMRVGAHVLFTALGYWLLVRIAAPVFGEMWTHSTAELLADLWVIVLALVTSRFLRTPVAPRLYLIAACTALAGVFVRELDGHILYLTLLSEIVAIHLAARALEDEAVKVFAHMSFAVLTGWLLSRLILESAQHPAVVNAQSVCDLLVIATGLALCRIFEDRTERTVYRLAAHAAILLWILRELHALPNGQGLVTIAWGAYAISLLIAGLRLNLARLRWVALGTLLLVVGKLFLVDLAKLEYIWRVLLFIGFGGIFLALSYWFPTLWRTSDAADDNTAAPRN
jgi:uncharacterized membrane protein